MNPWTGVITLSVLCLCLHLQHRQVNAFLREHHTPSLPSRLSDAVSLIYIALGIFFVYQWDISALLMFTALLPLLWLDAYRHWLPLRFTNAFWCIGLLTHFLPINETLTPLSAVMNSMVIFCLMGTLWWGLKRYYKREVLGLGDVHLIAGLFAWCSPTTALHSCGVAFFLLVLPMAVNKKPQPLAPYLCLSLLAGIFIAEFIPI